MKTIKEYEKEIIERQSYLQSIGFKTPTLILSPIAYAMLSKSEFAMKTTYKTDFVLFSNMKVCEAYKLGKDFVIEIEGKIKK